MKYVSFGMDGIFGVKNVNPKIRVTLQPNNVDDELVGDEYSPGVTIMVEDNGPGISNQDRENIFQRGYRGEYTASQTVGSGIGLHISQQLISRMGGSLEILENQPSHLSGTVMRFVLYRKPKSCH